MRDELTLAACFTALLYSVADARPAASIPFVDGLWHGGIELRPITGEFMECWASTTFDDGTTFRLAERRDGNWSLQLSNPNWRLPHSRRYDMVSLVDFYPSFT